MGFAVALEAVIRPENTVLRRMVAETKKELIPLGRAGLTP
jgi:hypothetical protein